MTIFHLIYENAIQQLIKCFKSSIFEFFFTIIIALIVLNLTVLINVLDLSLKAMNGNLKKILNFFEFFELIICSNNLYIQSFYF